MTCPAGQIRPDQQEPGRHLRRRVRGVPLREQCTTAKDGRSMTIHPHDGLLRAARAQPPRRRIPAGLPHPVSHRAEYVLDREPERPPGPAPLHRHRQERRLAAQPVRRDQPAHLAAARADPLRRGLGAALTGQHPPHLPLLLLPAPPCERPPGPPPQASPADIGASRCRISRTTTLSTRSGLFRGVLGEPPRLAGRDLQQCPLEFLGRRPYPDAVVGRDRLGGHRGREVLGSAAPPVPGVEGKPDAPAAGSSRPGGGRGDDAAAIAMQERHKRTDARLTSSVRGRTMPDSHTLRPSQRIAHYRQQPPQEPGTARPIKEPDR